MKRNTYAILAIIAAIAAVFIISQQGLTLFGQPVYLPLYASAKCIARAESPVTTPQVTVPSSGAFYKCITGAAGTYVPPDRTKCSFTITSGGTYDAYTAPIQTTSSLSTITIDTQAEAEQYGTKVHSALSGIFAEPTKSYDVIGGQQMYIKPAILSRVTFTGKYPAYGLEVTAANGRVFPTTTSCDLTSLYTVKGTDNTPAVWQDPSQTRIVVPDSPYNVVMANVLAFSTQVVTIQGINNGQPIYIEEAGQYNPVIDSGKGWLYVDTTKTITDNRIQCVPRQSQICSDDAKFVNFAESSCDWQGGTSPGYNSVPGDPTQLCKYQCVNGHPSVDKTQCITVQKCTDPKLPLWNTYTGECVAQSTTPPKPDHDYTLLFIILGGAAVVLAMLAVKKAKTGKVF